MEQDPPCTSQRASKLGDHRLEEGLEFLRVKCDSEKMLSKSHVKDEDIHQESKQISL